MKEVKIFNRVLTQDEIDSEYRKKTNIMKEVSKESIEEWLSKFIPRNQDGYFMSEIMGASLTVINIPLLIQKALQHFTPISSEGLKMCIGCGTFSDEIIDKKLLRYLTVKVKNFDLVTSYFEKKQENEKFVKKGN